MLFHNLLFVVLAGNDSDPNILGGVGQPSKFFMPFDGNLVGERILRALDGSDRCKAIYVAAPPDCVESFAFECEHPLHLADHGQTRMLSMMSAIDAAEVRRHYEPGDYVLVITGDLPLLSPVSIDHFVGACQEHEVADCYLGMVPCTAVDDEMRPLLRREGLTFRGQSCLHTDVYLMRPAAMSKASRDRVDGIMAIRRTGSTTLRGMIEAVTLVMQIVGLRGLVPFAKVVSSLPNRRLLRETSVQSGPDRLETSVLDLIEQGFGLRLCLVPIDEPLLALGIDYAEDVDMLVAYARSRDALATPTFGSTG